MVGGREADEDFGDVREATMTERERCLTGVGSRAAESSSCSQGVIHSSLWPISASRTGDRGQRETVLGVVSSQHDLCRRACRQRFHTAQQGVLAHTGVGTSHTETDKVGYRDETTCQTSNIDTSSLARPAPRLSSHDHAVDV